MRKLTISGFIAVLTIPIVILILILTRILPLEATYKTVKIANTTVKAEVADNFLKRAEGLMSKKSLSANGGMLFIFDSESYPGIWMMNMSFPIDIMWIDKNLKIVDIVKDAQPCTFDCTVYYPKEKSLYVLEVNSGFASEHGIKVGDPIKIS